MKKINKKQKFIMRLAGMFLFAIALILTLNLIFNTPNSVYKKYAGKWMIGYEFYEGKTKDKLLQTFEQEMHLLKDGTFYTKEEYVSYGETNNKVSGTYEINNGKIVLSYEQNNEKKKDTLIIKNDKLCLTEGCSTYYTLDKIEKYFPIYNSTINTNEDE